MKRVLLLAAMALVTVLATAGQTSHRLFQFERSKNRNYICYDVMTLNEKLDKDNPLHAYWVQAETDGKTNELSFFQKKMAFGYNVIHEGDNDIIISLKAYDNLPIHVYKRGDKWVATTILHGKEIVITKMYAQLRSPNSLHVVYVDIFGTAVKTGETIRERINND